MSSIGKLSINCIIEEPENKKISTIESSFYI